MALYFLTELPSSLLNAPPSSIILDLPVFQNPFLRHETSVFESVPQPLALLPCDSPLSLSGTSPSCSIVSFQVCRHLVSLKARLTQTCLCRVVVCVELVSGHPRPSLFGHQCTVGVLAGTHGCATKSRMTLWQSANPCVCWLES